MFSEHGCAIWKYTLHVFATCRCTRLFKGLDVKLGNLGLATDICVTLGKLGFPGGSDGKESACNTGY